jgi:uncharacterized repeat protein (TIGR01451 family)
VVAPDLVVDVQGSKEAFLGRKVRYDIKVTNRGDGMAEDVVLSSNLPSNADLLSLSPKGQRSGKQVIWRNLGSLKPGESLTSAITLMPDSRGIVQLDAQANASCATQIADWSKTIVKGIPAILLEVVDLKDPVEIGDISTYVINVTNQGSADGTNIVITATLEETMSYVSSGGPTRAQVSGRIIKFRPLPKLAPKQKVAWQVKVKAVKPEDVRFQVKLLSDQIRRSVDETEATTFYQ